MSPLLASTRRPSTLRLLCYMAASGIAVGAVLYVAFVIGVTRDPLPVHVVTAQHFNYRGAV